MSGRPVHALEGAPAPGSARAGGTVASTGIARSDLGGSIALLGLLALVVAARWGAIQGGVADPIVIGLGFGLALAAIAAIGRSGPPSVGALPSLHRAGRRGLARSVLIGVLGGAALVTLALVGRTLAGAPGLLPPLRGDLFAPWAVATILVASGEEAVLRGALFDRLLRGAGIWPAILVTSLVFALMHVPFYGWRVVPLDLGVGIWFAGLRLWSGGIVAPSISHALADLATWWL